MSAAKSLSILSAIDFLIRIETGPDAGKVYRIFPPKVDIGRDPALQIVVNDPKASRKQCSITIKDEVILNDHSGRQTTFVNGQHANNHSLKPNDIISFGETQIRFLAKAREQKAPAVKQQQAAVTAQIAAEKKKAKLRFHIFLAGAVLVGALLYLLEEDPTKPSKTLTTAEELKKQQEEGEIRRQELRENLKEKRKLDNADYLMSVEKHFVQGFRDLQTQNYGRALDAFGTTIATDSSHSRAVQYAKIAERNRQDRVDRHMRDGMKYKEKLMYDRCESEFEKAMILINDKRSQKYSIAKGQLDECRLLNAGGR
ncbi:MAG: FHA domain-containing protein [Bdellovibrionales bacterium]|nr:FHA domain-containing protein [Bdellovibrionales bacterium]